MPAISLPLNFDLSPEELCGYLACALVLATFAVRSMQRLRYLAILSNVVFIYYAGALGLTPIVILHAVLLPLNIWRLMEVLSESPISPDETDDDQGWTESARVGGRG